MTKIMVVNSQDIYGLVYEPIFPSILIGFFFTQNVDEDTK